MYVARRHKSEARESFGESLECTGKTKLVQLLSESMTLKKEKKN
jgi:hypothetical protein